MREETVTRKIYTFSELSDEAKAKAREWYRNGDDDDFPWSREYRESLETFADVFGITRLKWSVGAYSCSYCTGTVSGENADISGLRLYRYLCQEFFNYLYPREYLKTVESARVKNIPGFFKGGRFRNQEGVECVPLYSRLKRTEGGCPFTGYCVDEDLLDPIREFLKHPSDQVTYSDLMAECLDSWARALRKDMEYQYSDECVDENIVANEYEFLENGEPA